ncbi:MAG: SH3 domain-containing protein [Stenomitos frigidus ULC029]
MKPNASVLAIARAISFAALAGLTVACAQSSVTPPEASTSAPTAVPANQPPRNAPSDSVPTTVQKQTTEPASQTADNRTVESCVVKMAVVNDPKPPLNVRSTPSTASDNVVGQLKNGTFVTVAGDENGWLQIKTPMKGWVSKQQTVSGCNQKVERLSLSADGSTVQVADRFIGTGSHRYMVSVQAGQTLTINRDRGPFPMIIAPDGTVLLGHEKDDQRSTWSKELAQTGDYTIELESNFKGYRYAFSMQMK